MDWIFKLDDIEVDEPIGFADIELSLMRDEKYHGIVNEAAMSSMEFHGDGAAYLLDKYESDGIQANVTFSAEVDCGGTQEQVISGRLNFGKMRKKCGVMCSVSIPWEQESCAVVLKARFNQKVDVDKAVGVDGITPLQEYAAIGVETEVPGQNIFVAAEGYVEDTGDVITLDIFPADPQTVWIRPTYGRKIFESINETYLIPNSFAAASSGFGDDIISPIVLYDDSIPCFDGVFTYYSRLKGSTNVSTFVNQLGSINIVFAYGEFPDSLTILHSTTIFAGALNGTLHSFDVTVSGTVSIPPGQGVYHYVEIAPDILMVGLYGGNVTFDKETYTNITANQLCPPTTADLYAVHETLSRVTEAVTNGCARVRSDYFGRTDSEPFAADQDGCGGLRTLTSGLKIRKAEEDKFFASPQDLIEGLNAIDNIGFAVQKDPDIDGAAIVRIEDVDYFYKDELMLKHDSIPASEEDVEEAKHYSIVNVGYKKWETQKVNGLEEFNSNRQYNTSIDTVNSQLDITSSLVAAGLPLEITRQQSFSESGGADAAYDNEIFIISMIRTGYGLAVEQGGIDNPQNIYSPSTTINFRLSPVRNLMRWYKTIAAAFASIASSTNQLFFSSGTGNLVAGGMLADSFCRLENNVIRENQNIFVTNFSDQSETTPLWKNQLVTYEYPMSIAEYQKIKTAPYGYIEFQCGQGDFRKGFIKEIKFKPAKGIAEFTLRVKYGI